MTTLPFTNFTKGEIAPELQARIDTGQYGAAAKKVRNFIIQRYGGLSFRPGFRVVGEVDNVDKNIRYAAFQYNVEQSYVMALEDENMRLLAGGGFVIEENLKITAITKEATAKVTAAYHDYEVGDRIYFDGIEGMIELNDRYARVTAVVDTDNFRIDVNTTGFGTFVSSDGTVRGAPPTPPPPDPPPPTPPPPPPDPPPVTGTGGSGGGTGGGSGGGSPVGGTPGWSPDDYYVREP
jgi:hypothetical protein